MQASLPKQYLEFAGKPLLLETLARIVRWPLAQHIVVVTSRSDEHFATLESDIDSLAASSADRKTTWHHVAGGATRAASVSNGLTYIRQHSGDDSWVLVHDAARPLVRRADVIKLCESVFAARHNTSVAGGILACPVTDTIKEASISSGRHDLGDLGRVRGAVVRSTIDREHLWQAQTPQLFQVGQLSRAVEHGLKEGWEMTDEASAIEMSSRHGKPLTTGESDPMPAQSAGESVLLVPGSSDNIKITRSADLALGEFLLAAQLEEAKLE